MKVEYRNSFAKDLRKLKDAKLKAQVREIIERLEQADSLQQVENLKRLRGVEGYYRIKLGDFEWG